MDDHSKAFSAAEVCFLTGVTYRKLDYWDRVGAIRPDIQKAHGSGNAHRRYSLDCACLVAVAKRLMDLGARTSIVQAVAQLLRDQPVLWTQAVVIRPQGGVVPLSDWDGSTGWIGASGWVIDLVAVREQVEKRVDDVASLVS